MKIHQATNSEIRTQTKVFNAATGDDVMPQDIKLYQEYADRKILLEAEELAMVKKFDLSGELDLIHNLCCIGVRPYLIRPSC